MKNLPLILNMGFDHVSASVTASLSNHHAAHMRNETKCLTEHSLTEAFQVAFAASKLSRVPCQPSLSNMQCNTQQLHDHLRAK